MENNDHTAPAVSLQAVTGEGTPGHRGSTIFSVRMLADALLRLRLPGIICLSLTLLAALAGPIAQLIGGSAHDSMRYLDMYDAARIAAPLCVVMLFSPIFTFTCFAFLRDRAKSDFYHSLPYTREAMYTGYFAALLALQWGIIITVTLLRIAVIAFLPLTEFTFGAVVRAVFAYMVVTFFITAFCGLACSVSGTSVAAYFAFGLMFLWTRATVSSVVSTFDHILPMFSSEHSFLGVLTFDSFLPASLMLSVLSSLLPATVSVFSNFPVLLYTLAVSVIFFFIGLFAFRGRRSETAGMPGAHPVVQHAFRTAFAALFAVEAAGFFLKGAYLPDGSCFVSSIIYSGITLLAGFAYELVTTKRLRSALRAVPYIGLSFVFAALLAGGMAIYRTSFMKHPITADEIQAVSMDVGDIGYSGYELLRTSGIDYSDPAIISIISDCLSDSYEATRSGSFHIDGDIYSDTYDTGARTVELTMSDGRTVYRRVRMDDETYRLLMSLFADSAEFMSEYLRLPDDREVSYVYTYPLTADSAELWQIFCEEYRSLSETDKYAVKTGSYFNYLFSFSVGGEYGHSSFISDYRVSPALMPRTALALCTQMNSTVTEGKTSLQWASELLASIPADAEIDYGLTVYSSGENEYFYTDFASDSVVSNVDLMADVLTTPVSGSAEYPLVMLEIHYTPSGSDWSDSIFITCYYSVTPEGLQRLLSEFLSN